MEKPRDTHSLNEGQARYILIATALRAAGWNLDDRTQAGFEVPVDGYDAEHRDGKPDFCCKHTMIASGHGYSS